MDEDSTSDSKSSNPEFELGSEPDPAQFDFDLEGTLASLVFLRAQIPDEALTAAVLGTERGGHGVVISDKGIVVTVGYLVTEAQEIWLTSNDGRTVPGHVLGYDQESGLGFVQTLQPLDLPPVELGVDDDLQLADLAVVAGHGGRENAINVQVTGKAEFAGYWEYLLDEAVYAAPAHPSWGGAALIAHDGKLYGVGSLLVQRGGEENDADGANLFVPVGLIKPVLEDFLTHGRRIKPARPWLGIFTDEIQGHLVARGLYENGPAYRGGIEVGDVFVAVGGEPVSGLADLWRRVWALGDAGVEVPITVARDGTQRDITVASVDRNNCLYSPRMH